MWRGRPEGHLPMSEGATGRAGSCALLVALLLLTGPRGAGQGCEAFEDSGA